MFIRVILSIGVIDVFTPINVFISQREEKDN